MTEVFNVFPQSSWGKCQVKTWKQAVTALFKSLPVKYVTDDLPYLRVKKQHFFDDNLHSKIGVWLIQGILRPFDD
jgi:hypothetical protein